MIKIILKSMFYPIAFSIYKMRINFVAHLVVIGYLSVDEGKEKLERMSWMFREKWINKTKEDA